MNRIANNYHHTGKKGLMLMGHRDHGNSSKYIAPLASIIAIVLKRWPLVEGLDFEKPKAHRGDEPAERQTYDRAARHVARVMHAHIDTRVRNGDRKG